MKVTFDGSNKLININPDVSSINVIADLYSAWKHWLLESDNTKYPQAFRTFGGDPTNREETQFAPQYFFLMNNWKVLVDGIDLVVQSNLYTDSGESPFTVINNGSVSNRNSDSQVVINDIEKVLDYQNMVHIDINSTYSGNDWPIGTSYRPVNNLTDALVIAAKWNIRQFLLMSNLICDQPIPGFRIFSLTGNFTFNANGYSINQCLLEKVKVEGDLADSFVNITQCFISENGIQNVHGLIHESILHGDILIAKNQNLTIMNSFSNDPNGEPIILNMHPNENTTAVVRAFSGDIKIIYCDTPTSTATIEFIAGNIIFNNTDTDGFLTVRGIATVDNTANGSNIDTIGLLSPNSLNVDATNVWEQLLSEHHELGTFGDLMQKIQLDAHKTSLNRFE